MDEQFLTEHHKLLWFFTLYHTHKEIFYEYIKEKNIPEKQVKEIIKLSNDFKRLFPNKFLELSKE